MQRVIHRARSICVISGLAAIVVLAAAGGCCFLHPAAPIVSPAPTTVLASFCISNRIVRGRELTIYTTGQGPGVLLLHEIPALTTECLRLADSIAHRGFKVYVPLLFGKPPSAAPPSSLRGLLGACAVGGFRCFSAVSPGPIAEEMRALSAQLHAEDSRGMGVVGLCITGSLPLALVVDPWVGALVLGQPALPFGVSSKSMKALPVAAAALTAIRQRQVPVLALRFSEDCISPRVRMKNLCGQLGRQLEVLEVVSGAGADNPIPATAHAVLTAGLDETRRDAPTQVALGRVLGFLSEHLQSAAVPPAGDSAVPFGEDKCKWTELNARVGSMPGSIHRGTN